MDKLIDLFKIYLEQQTISSLSTKNYLVDLRNFLQWYILYLKTNKICFNHNSNKINQQNAYNLISLLTSKIIKDYKQFLLEGKTPYKTINRRLTTLRKLGSFALANSWLNINPALSITNITTKTVKPAQKPLDFQLVDQFIKDLKTEGASTATIKNYTVDIKQFLSFNYNL